MSNIKETIKTLIQAARDGKATLVRSSIHSALGLKIKEALGKRETEVAKTLFANKEQK